MKLMTSHKDSHRKLPNKGNDDRSHLGTDLFKKSAQFTDLYYVYAGYFRISENPKKKQLDNTTMP